MGHLKMSQKICGPARWSCPKNWPCILANDELDLCAKFQCCPTSRAWDQIADLSGQSSNTKRTPLAYSKIYRVYCKKDSLSLKRSRGAHGRSVSDWNRLLLIFDVRCLNFANRDRLTFKLRMVCLQLNFLKLKKVSSNFVKSDHFPEHHGDSLNLGGRSQLVLTVPFKLVPKDWKTKDSLSAPLSELWLGARWALHSKRRFSLHHSNPNKFQTENSFQ